MADTSRRDLLLFSGAAASALGLGPLLAGCVPKLPDETAQTDDDYDLETLRFWLEEAHQISPAVHLGVTALDDDPYIPDFFYWRSPSGNDPGALLYRPDMTSEGLPDQGDVAVNVRVQLFHPSEPDRETLVNAKSAALRLDLRQVDPLPSLVEALIWTAVAALIPKANGRLPGGQELNWDPAKKGLKDIPLVNGKGEWAWNFFIKPRTRVWRAILDQLVKTAVGVVPFLGLPAYAYSGMQAVNALWGTTIAYGRQPSHIFKGAQQPVAATQQAWTVGTLPLQTAQYVIVPRRQVKDLGDAREELKLSPDGVLMHRDLDNTRQWEEYENRLPGMTYITIRIATETDTSEAA